MVLLGDMKDFYKYKGFWWTSSGHEDNHDIDSVDGPYCIECYGDIGFPNTAYVEYEEDDVDLNIDWTGEVNCLNCSKKFKLTISLGQLKISVAQILKSHYRATLNKIALDEPLTQVKVRDEDESYFLAAKIGQKDGKKVGVVYFGDKKKDQNKKDYAQIFIDLDEEQMRFDKANKHPLGLAAKFSVEFPESTVISETKPQRVKK